MTTAAVILAAGGGKRWDGEGHKLLVDFKGKPVISWALESANEAGLDDLIVISGAVDISNFLPKGAVLLHNSDWELGQSKSLQLAVSWAKEKRYESLVFGLGDMPGVSKDAWIAVAKHPAPLVTATFNGARRPPVKISSDFFDDLPSEGDEGARILFAGGNQAVVEVSCLGSGNDIDTLEDMRQWS